LYGLPESRGQTTPPGTGGSTHFSRRWPFRQKCWPIVTIHQVGAAGAGVGFHVQYPGIGVGLGVQFTGVGVGFGVRFPGVGADHHAGVGCHDGCGIGVGAGASTPVYISKFGDPCLGCVTTPLVAWASMRASLDPACAVNSSTSRDETLDPSVCAVTPVRIEALACWRPCIMDTATTEQTPMDSSSPSHGGGKTSPPQARDNRTKR